MSECIEELLSVQDDREANVVHLGQGGMRVS